MTETATDTLVIAGIDEVGRGSVAGPVVAGACIVSLPLYRRRRAFTAWSPFKRKPLNDCHIADSKLLTPEERETAYAWIVAHCAFGVGIVDVSVVETRGILAATQQAMLLALEQLCATKRPALVHVDGCDHFRFPIAHRSIIRGDATQPEIAAASIVAKVTRDRIMREQAAHFPLYGFAAHKGYGTPEHLVLIEKHGVCPLHRRTFLRRILENQTLPFPAAGDED